MHRRRSDGGGKPGWPARHHPGAAQLGGVCALRFKRGTDVRRSVYHIRSDRFSGGAVYRDRHGLLLRRVRADRHGTDYAGDGQRGLQHGDAGHRGAGQHHPGSDFHLRFIRVAGNGNHGRGDRDGDRTDPGDGAGRLDYP